ncbi:hypothetical protein LguiA_027364 [Lonicera macranthoides]
MSTFLFLLLSPFHTATSLTPSSDITALQSFKSSIKPTTIPPYSCLSSWNFTTTIHPCSLPRTTHFTCGLTCTNSRVTQLTLDPAGYFGTLSPVISKLTYLTLIDLSDNNFFGPIPSSLSSLPNLRTLILRSNSFSGSVPYSLTALKSLESLDFSQNLISGSLPNSMNQLTSLRRLDLSFNKLIGSIPKLPGNSLSGSLFESSFSGLTQLEVVELSENSLTGILQHWLFLLPSIQQVDLANNSFTRVEIWKPRDLNSGLMAIDLGFNQIEGNLPLNLSDYPVLTSLNLRSNKLRGPIPLEYGNKVTLKRLYLDGNFLNGFPPMGLFSGESSVSGSLADNCLQSCPVSSQLCLKSQKSTLICRQAYRGKPTS